ncbi:hypothetical protein [Oceanidesulfovibrio marinus]|uniref:Uncharacterized protein n=1 Tax=Oceanidesulfovibrio marinus TaxID=370038 RepID=A0A6P1ZMH6_9BACT|nr:hypothetical protein [Oceanidesulfovibrio marinus]TVM35635.1 hypothetical protein DQK91_02925 [Oceanidesulfovibrio marinus]
MWIDRLLGRLGYMPISEHVEALRLHRPILQATFIRGDDISGDFLHLRIPHTFVPFWKSVISAMGVSVEEKAQPCRDGHEQ